MRAGLDLGGWGLSARIVALSLALLLLVQAAVFSALRISIGQSARDQIAQELLIGERVCAQSIFSPTCRELISAYNSAAIRRYWRRYRRQGWWGRESFGFSPLPLVFLVSWIDLFRSSGQQERLVRWRVPCFRQAPQILGDRGEQELVPSTVHPAQP